MPYNKTNWLDRIVQYPNRFAKSGETSTEVTLNASPGIVTQAGTLLLATYLNNLETQYDKALGTANTDVNKPKAVFLETDTRSTVLTYTAGVLTKVEEKDGVNVIKTTNLIYTSGVLTSVEEIAGGTTVTTTLNYDVNGNLTDTSKAVV